MPVKGIQHYNIRAPLPVLERARDFYVGVLGMTPGDRPAFATSGVWLYAGGDPIVHLSARSTGDEPDAEADGGQGFLTHLALKCTGLDAMLRRLIEFDIPFEIDEDPSHSQVQIYVADPAGVELELTFIGER